MAKDGSRGGGVSAVWGSDKDLYEAPTWNWSHQGYFVNTRHMGIWDSPNYNVPVDISKQLHNIKIDMLIARIDGLLSK